jgi:hypothetical protein
MADRCQNLAAAWRPLLGLGATWPGVLWRTLRVSVSPRAHSLALTCSLSSLAAAAAAEHQAPSWALPASHATTAPPLLFRSRLQLRHPLLYPVGLLATSIEPSWGPIGHFRRHRRHDHHHSELTAVPSSWVGSHTRYGWCDLIRLGIRLRIDHR